MFKVINKGTKKRKEVALIVFLCCFTVFTVKLEQVNVCQDNCCIVKFFKTYLKVLTKMNTFGWCKNRYLLKIKMSTPTESRNREF